MKKTNRLGRGLNALIPDTKSAPISEDATLLEIEVLLIRPNPYQPRLEFDPVALQELKSSIEENGVIQPITVRRVDDHYELISGERRLRAVTEIGLDKVPCYIRQIETKEEMLELAIIENVQRERLNPIEQAQAYQRLIDECKLTQDEVAQKIGKERSTITNIIRLLKLPSLIQDSVRKSEISMGHARSLLAITNEKNQKSVWKQIVKDGLSVRKVESLVKEANEKSKTKPKKKEAPRRSIFLQKVEDNLRDSLGTKVNIRPKKEGGTIEVDFYSPEDLSRLVELFDQIQDK
ncbi:MAG: ParB/RepB/Spo0J family partition protein [Calditrichaeota bacterium]|nr:MAG: ParB/RepB/Spo0J family partition protein [Calditrichota bacterium]MBL1206692.1 ParB/RepB/Spo0J family partition protein [Calditrichota bacterium]NOG46519.1 ParB/RepB/Spo0J family partition protein [Calditrichota bacterium]